MTRGLIREVGKRKCQNGHTVIYDIDVEAIAALPEWKNGGQSKPRSHGTRFTLNPDPVHREPLTILEPPLNHDGGGIARESSEIAPPKTQSADPQPEGDSPTFRECLLDAMGASRTGIVNARPTGLGGRVDMLIAEKWRLDLGLSESTILTVISEAMARKRDGPPSTFKYFTQVTRGKNLMNRADAIGGALGRQVHVQF